LFGELPQFGVAGNQDGVLLPGCFHSECVRSWPRSQGRLRSRLNSFRRFRARSPRRSEPLKRPSHSLQSPLAAFGKITSSPSTLTVRQAPSPRPN
jgi:hypothetical protein